MADAIDVPKSESIMQLIFPEILKPRGHEILDRPRPQNADTLQLTQQQETMPIDINELRDYKGGDPAKWRTYMEQHFKDPNIVDAILQLDVHWRQVRISIDKLRKEVNQLQKTVIAPKKKAKEPCDAEVAQMKEMQAKIKELEAQLPEIAKQHDKLLGQIGNLVDPEVPISQDEDAENLVVCLHPMPNDEVTLPTLLGTLEYTLPPTKLLTHDDLLWRIGGYEPV